MLFLPRAVSVARGVAEISRTTAATVGAWDPEVGPRVAGWAPSPTRAGEELPTTTCRPATRTGVQVQLVDSAGLEVSYPKHT